MQDRLWSYKELKHVVINANRQSHELAGELNTMFHDGETVRSAADIARIRAKKTILDREK